MLRQYLKSVGGRGAQRKDGSARWGVMEKTRLDGWVASTQAPLGTKRGDFPAWLEKRWKTRLTVTRPLEAIKEKSHKFEYEKVKLLYDKK